MEGEDGKFIKGADADGREAAAPLFSAFRQPPPAQPGPAPAEKSSAITAMETRLAGLEKKLLEAAEKEKARGPEKEMLEYLKVKTGELETRLRDSQEKALAFAYELKGREEAHKESRRETEDLLAAVKRQQEAAETGQRQAVELKRAGERIETLEARLTELASKPPAPTDPALTARIEELAGKLDAVPGLLKPVSDRINDAFDRIGALSARLKTDLRENIADTLGPHVKRLEGRLLAASEQKLDARMELEFSAYLKKSKEEIELFINSLDKSAGGLAEVLSGRLGEIREGLRVLSAEAAAAGTGAEKAVQWLKGMQKEKGRAAADGIAGSYDAGFLQASLDNLEKCVSSALDTLARARAGAEEDGERRPELLQRRRVSDLEAAIRSLRTGLAVFHGIRTGIVGSINRKLTGE